MICSTRRSGCVVLAILMMAAFADGKDTRKSRSSAGRARGVKAQKPEKYLAKGGGKLKHDLVFEQIDSGTIKSGYKLTLKVDGSWRFAVIAAGKAKDTNLKGQLSKEQIRLLAEKMAKVRLTKLPEEFGAELARTAHRTFTISFGKQKTQLMLMPRRDIEWVAKNPEKTSEKHWERFSEAAEHLQKSVRWDRLVLGDKGD